MPLTPNVCRDGISVAGSKLHGVPIFMKDLISSHGMSNTDGLCCLVGSNPTKEASLVTKLRAAGVIILGKANMPQWGNARSSLKAAPNGWSKHMEYITRYKTHMEVTAARRSRWPWASQLHQSVSR